MNIKTDCEVCGSKKLNSVLNLGPHPMCDDLIPITSTIKCEEFPIEILMCSVCLTAHQKFQIPKIRLFPKSYHYRSKNTSDVINGMQDLVANVLEFFPDGIKNIKVLDIGSNDGSLLDIFARYGAKTFGIEPTDAALDSKEKSHLIYQKYFDKEVSDEFKIEHGFPDIITFTNVFAHIEDFKTLIAALKHLMGPSTLLVIENHYLGSILDTMQFDTFYHEHPRTYSAHSFIHVAKILNSKINSIQFPKRYGGNIRVFISNRENSPEELNLPNLLEKEKEFPILFQNLNAKIEKWKTETSLLINNLVSEYGSIPAKAFPGRAAILVKVLGLTSSQISAVYEKEVSKKIGHFLPGTRIPIKADSELTKISENLPILNLAWHIEAEIKLYLNKLGYKGDVINILEPSRY